MKIMVNYVAINSSLHVCGETSSNSSYCYRYHMKIKPCQYHGALDLKKCGTLLVSL